MTNLSYERGDVVSLNDPYGNDKQRSAVIISDGRRPSHADGVNRYNVVMLTTQLGEFGSHDWTVLLDADVDTKGDESLSNDSLVEPWGTVIVKEDSLSGPYTQLTDAGMKKVARSLANLVLK